MKRPHSTKLDTNRALPRCGERTMKRPHSTHTQFLSAPDVAAIVRHQGIAESLRGMADTIHADYLRWQDFDKNARVGNHSELGVIEQIGRASCRERVCLAV